MTVVAGGNHMDTTDLERYSRDLTGLARRGQLDPVTLGLLDGQLGEGDTIRLVNRPRGGEAEDSFVLELATGTTGD